MKVNIFRKLAVGMTAIIVSLGVMLSVNTISANAATEVQTAQDVVGYISGGGNPGSVGLITGTGTRDDATYNSQYQCVNVNGTYYYWKASDYANVQGKITNVGNNSADKVADDVNNITGGLSINADTGTATRTLSGFTGVINVLLGIIVILVTLGMGVFTAFDLCYISFPVFRNKCEDAKQSGQGLMASSKKTANGESKLRFVTDDAQYAVTAADTVQSGKSPYVIYFGKRLLSYVLLSVLIFILLTGNIDIFTRLALKLVSGILDVIQGI